MKNPVRMDENELFAEYEALTVEQKLSSQE